MKYYPVMLITILCHLIWCQAIQGQENANAKATGVSLKFVSVKKLPHKKFTLLVGKEIQEISISDWNVSAAYQVPVGVPCKVLPVGTTKESAGKAEVLAAFTLSSPKGQQLAVILPSINQPPPKYKVTLVDITQSALAGGERKFINLSRITASIKYGGESTLIPPMQTGIIPLPAGKNGDFLPVVGVFKIGDKVKKFMSSRWIRNDETRSILFLYPNRKSKTLSWHGVEVATVKY